MTAFHYESLILGKLLKIQLDKLILHPVLTHLSGLSIRDKLIGIESHIEAEIIVDHHLEGFALQALALIFIYGLGLEIALGTETVAVYSAASAELFKELGRELLMKRGMNVAQSVAESYCGFLGSECETAVWSAAYALHKSGIFGQSRWKSYHCSK